jgi:Peptidase family M28
VTTRDGNNLIVFEDTASEWLYNYTLGINTEYADYIHLTLHHEGSTWGSDHNSFWDEGYNALFYFENTETPYYHTSSDTVAHINATYAVKNIRLILATIAELSEAGFLNNPPVTPVLTGPTSGVINQAYNLSVVTTDAEGEDVYYFIEWGDSQVNEWVGPYRSGVTAVITHQWNKKGIYTIMAKAKDTYGIESNWGTMNVVMPIDYTSSFHTFLQHLLEKFPHMFPTLQHLKG